MGPRHLPRRSTSRAEGGRPAAAVHARHVALPSASHGLPPLDRRGPAARGGVARISPRAHGAGRRSARLDHCLSLPRHGACPQAAALGRKAARRARRRPYERPRLARGARHAARHHRGQCLHIHRAVPAQLAMVVGRFFTVGLACALLHNAIMIAGDWAGLHYVASSLVSFAIVVAVGYWLHSGWPFPDAARGRTPFARYALTMAANLPLS